MEVANFRLVFIRLIVVDCIKRLDTDSRSAGCGSGIGVNDSIDRLAVATDAFKWPSGEMMIDHRYFRFAVNCAWLKRLISIIINDGSLVRTGGL